MGDAEGRPLDPSAGLDLAGIAVGYQGGGITVAGGLRKFDRNGRADYVGMLRPRSRPYGPTAVGAYGVFPDGAGGEYTSFFVFGAVTARSAARRRSSSPASGAASASTAG